MRLAFYTPFVPLNHPKPSGDTAIARSVIDFLRRRGHAVGETTDFSSEWIWLRPWTLPGLLRARREFLSHLETERPDGVLVYHSYYRAPDLLGPLAAARGLPVFHFGSAYASRRRKKLLTRPGYELNLKSLRSATHCFTLKRPEYENLRRILPDDRATYVRPGIETQRFTPDDDARLLLRVRWNTGADVPIVLTVAMLRSGTKSEGVAHVIRALGGLHKKGVDFRYLVAGDGPERKALKHLADEHIPGKARFIGRIASVELPAVYSASDLYAFPGINEGLGMAYLEAQCAGLPAVGWDRWGAAECIAHGESGFLTPAWDMDAFTDAIRILATDHAKRVAMGQAARRRVLAEHDRDRNYVRMERIMKSYLGAAGPQERYAVPAASAAPETTQ
ncbi:MAG: glycosyltransferase family 4 protein [Oceanidesulfovibrio sp.]